MKWSFASIGLIILGLFGIVIIMLFNDITVSNEQDYYTLKYATEASMIEAVDTAYYRLTGEVKISQEKFVENFTRRFTETSTFGQGNYGITFYQITEYPAKVSLGIYDRTSGYNIYTYSDTVDTTRVDIVNLLSAILDGYEPQAINGIIYEDTYVKPDENKYSYQPRQIIDVPSSSQLWQESVDYIDKKGWTYCPWPCPESKYLSEQYYDYVNEVRNRDWSNWYNFGGIDISGFYMR